MKSLILTDVDEVLLDWTTSFESWYRNSAPNFGGTVPTNNLKSAHDIEDWLSCDIQVTRKLISQFNLNRKYFRDIQAYPEAIRYVNLMHKDGYKFVAITACGTDKWTREFRAENLEKYFPGVFDTIHCVDVGQSKLDYLSRYQPSWWVDDKVSHAEDGGKIGHKAFLVEQPYNVGVALKYSKRVKNWQDIYDCIVDEDCYRPGWMA